MNFKLGDKVSFINENIQGTIVKIMDKKTVSVAIEDGFDIPVLKSELIIIDSCNNEKKQIDSNKSFFFPDIDVKSFLLYFEPVGNNLFNRIFIHNFLYPLNISCFKIKKDELHFYTSSIIYPEKTWIIDKINFVSEEIKEPLLFAIIHNTNTKSLNPEIDYYSYIYKNKYFQKSVVKSDNIPVFIFPLIEINQNKYNENIARTIQSEYSTHQINVEKPKKTIDLHIEKLFPDVLPSTSDEIYKIQMDAFYLNFEKAVAFKYSSIIVIHGVGSNKLKNEIWSYLSKHNSVLSFSEADYTKFGYGATEIIFKI